MAEPTSEAQMYRGAGLGKSASNPARGGALKPWKNLGLASLGAMLEYYDFVVFIYVATKISADIFPPQMSETLRTIQTLTIYSIGFVIRPVAGLLIAHSADRFGRKRWFILTVIMMSVSTLMIGLLPGYAVIGWSAPALLLLLRVVQGCAVGGELPSAAVFVSEHARGGRLGTAGAVLQMMSYGGLLLGVLTAAAANSIATRYPDAQSLSWRLPFIAGGLLGAISGYLRGALAETPVFVEARRQGGPAPATPLRLVLREHLGACLFGFGLVLVNAGTAMVYFQCWPAILETQVHLPHGQALGNSLTAIVSIIVALPLWGLVYDRFGWAVPLRVGVIGSVFLSMGLFWILSAGAAGPDALTWVIVPVAMASGAVVAPVPGLLSSLFPTQVRQSGYALPYNVAVAIVGPMPVLLIWLSTKYGITMPLYVLLVSYALAIGLTLVLRRMKIYLAAGDPAM